MKILINVSNNLGGGGLQVALSFLSQLHLFPELEFIVCYRRSIAIEINNAVIINKNISLCEIKSENYFHLHRALGKIEYKTKPDVVFTIFGPSYWRPKSKHIMGYAIPHYIYNESPYFGLLNVFELCKLHIKKKIHLYLINRDADVIICETRDATERSKNIFEKICKFYTVSNTYNQTFLNKFSKKKILPQKKDDIKRFLTVTRYYKHKNLEILPKVARLLLNSGVQKFEFILTILKDDYDRIIPLDLHKYIITTGPISITECPNLYEECDFMILPTLLECFSANYPEAMIMKKPILTSHYGFANTICEDAALYFDPLNPEDIANTIMRLLTNKALQQQLIKNGKKQLSKFPSPQQRAQQYIDIISSVLENN